MYTLTSFNSEQFLNKIVKRGNLIDQEKKKVLINFEKKYRENININDCQFEELLNNPIISQSEKNLIKLFKKYVPNINYISYILIINSLEVQDIKNLNRYVIINWNRTKNSFKSSQEFEYIRSINFSEISDLENINNKKEIIDKFINLIIQFVEKENTLIDFSTHLVFIMNSLQSYFCPSN